MNPRLVQIIALVASAGLLLAAAQFTPSINEGRKRMNMIGERNPQETAPPEYAFAIQAFGAFRGILTNIAFIRAEEYKEQGRYYDAMQLADWISKLQPRFPSVWEFLSWNMAWNISVTTYTPEERWNWVYSGAKLIRDQGLFYNPAAINLYKQLAWIFVNKMSETTDDYHMFYKRQWAWRMHLVLGAPPDPLGEYDPKKPFERIDSGARDTLFALVAGREPPPPPEKGQAASQPAASDQVDSFALAQKASYDWMKAIADAPEKLSDLYAQFPDAAKMVSALRDLNCRINDDKLEEDVYWAHPDGLAWRFFYRVRLLSEPPGILQRVSKKKASDPDADAREAFDKIVGVRSGNPAGAALIRFMQKKVLSEVYKLKPARMAELIAAFGPIDFRVVDAHSLYWVQEGLIAGNETVSKFGNDKVNTARLIFFSLRNLHLRNRITFEPYTDDVNYAYFNMDTDLNFIKPMHEAFITYGPMLEPSDEKGGAGETYKTGHVNFLVEAIRTLYFAGRVREAQFYYDYLREHYGKNSDGTPNANYQLPLHDHVMKMFAEAIDIKEAQQAVNGLFAASFETLSQGNVVQFNMLVGKAQEVYNNYQTKDRADKVRFPPIRDMQADVLRLWLRQPPTGPGITLNKARLWLYLPVYLKQAVYDEMIDGLKKECEVMEFDAAVAFPEPPGMEEYRKAHPVERRAKEEKNTADTPAQQFQ